VLVFAVTLQIQGLEFSPLLFLPPHIDFPTKPDEEREMREPATSAIRPSVSKQAPSPLIFSHHKQSHSPTVPFIPKRQKKREGNAKRKRRKKNPQGSQQKRQPGQLAQALGSPRRITVGVDVQVVGAADGALHTDVVPEDRAKQDPKAQATDRGPDGEVAGDDEGRVRRPFAREEVGGEQDGEEDGPEELWFFKIPKSAVKSSINPMGYGGCGC